VAHVWQAMKKHQAEQAAKAAAVQRLKDAGWQRLADSEAACRHNPIDLDGCAPGLVVRQDPRSRIAEQYRALRTNLLARYPDGRFCLVVTSAEPGEGKTVTCFNLALVLAENKDRHTAIVDLGLRGGAVARLAGVEKSPGVADFLRGTATLDAAVRPTSEANLFIIPAGEARPDEAAGLLAKPELDGLIADLRRKFDYVLLDTPAVSLAPDAGTLGRAVGDGLLVVRVNKTRRDAVDRAIRLLRAAGIKPVGITLTHQE